MHSPRSYVCSHAYNIGNRHRIRCIIIRMCSTDRVRTRTNSNICVVSRVIIHITIHINMRMAIIITHTIMINNTTINNTTNF